MSQKSIKIDINLRGYLTAYIDLLGVSKRLNEVDEGALTGQISPELMKIVGENTINLQQFRSAFNDYYSSLGAFSNGHPNDPPYVVELLKIVQPESPIINTFSDSVIISVPFDRTRLGSVYSSYYCLILGCAAASLKMLALGVLVRGGISLGYGNEVFPGEVIGAGLVRAYRLESDKRYRMPHIIIDKALVKEMRPPDARKRDTREQKYAVAIWKETQNLLSKCEDSLNFVHFLGQKHFTNISKKMRGENIEQMATDIDNIISKNLVRPSISAPDDHWQAWLKWEWMDSYWQKNRSEVLALADTSKGNK